MTKDYYWEYIQIADDILNELIQEVEKQMPEALCFHGISLAKGALTSLSYRLLNNTTRDYYNTQRKAGKTKDLLQKEIWDVLIREYIGQDTDWLQEESVEYDNVLDEAYREVLLPYAHCYIFYCVNYRQFNYMLPVFKHFQETAVVISEQMLPEDIELNENIVVLEMQQVGRTRHQSCYLQQFFPLISEFADLFDIILNFLSPRGAVFLEGSHDSSTVLNALCRAKGVPTFCIQQGWPAVIHSRFRNMEYDYCLTWGKAYNELWKKYNPIPYFVDVGYIYEISDKKTDQGITFFLQSPVYIIDEFYFGELLQLAHYCARTYTERMIYIREHPEYRLAEHVKMTFGNYGNVQFVTDEPLQKVFARTEIAVAVFSSTLMEGFIHDTIPFVFNSCTDYRWYPDIEELGLGVIVTSLQEGKRKMDELLFEEERKHILQTQIQSSKKQYCTAIAGQAVENILECLTTWRLGD